MPPRRRARLDGFTQRVRRLTQRVGRLGQLPLELAVLEQGLRRRLAVAHAPVGATSRGVRREQVRAKLLVLQETLDVSARLCRACGFAGLAETVLRCHVATASAESFQVRNQYTPLRARPYTRQGASLGVQRGLLLRGGKRPSGTRAALLAEHEAQLLRWFELRIVRPEGRTRLCQLERAQQVDTEVALLAAHLLRRPFGRPLGLLSLHQHTPQATGRIERTGRDQSTIRQATQGAARTQPANRKENSCYPEIARNQSRSCDNHAIDAALSGRSRCKRSSSGQMRILVTGASGFVGSLLVPRLRTAGHTVRALGRDPQRVRAALARVDSVGGRAGAANGVEVVRADALSADGLAPAFAGVDVAYYLIHSMERPSAPGVSFPERERLAAENFAAAARRAGVQPDRLPRRTHTAREHGRARRRRHRR